MPAVVVDTHSITWYLAKNPALSKAAEAALDRASAEGHPIYVPSICLAELLWSLLRAARCPICRTESSQQPLLRCKVPLVSRDRKIRASVVNTIW